MYKPDVSFKILSKPWDKPELLTKFTQKPILKSMLTKAVFSVLTSAVAVTQEFFVPLR